MKIEKEQRDSGLLVSVSGRLDVTTAPEFQETCMELVNNGCDTIIVDLTGLEYTSSAGLRSILFLAKELKKKGGALKFCGLNGMVEEVFKVSGFYSMFTIVPTADDIE